MICQIRGLLKNERALAAAQGQLLEPTSQARLQHASLRDISTLQQIRVSCFKRGSACLVCAAAGRTRLSTSVATVPRRIELYFGGHPLRKAIWAAIAFSTGFYSANTVSLSFGALAINDVVAAAVSVAFCEIVSYQYYSAPRVTLKLLFLNSFKIGVVAAFIADAWKLGG